MDSVALAFNRKGSAVMEQPVQNRIGSRFIAHKQLPLSCRTVARHNEAFLLIPQRNQVVQQLRLHRRQRRIAELVDDQKPGLVDFLELFSKAPSL